MSMGGQVKSVALKLDVPFTLFVDVEGRASKVSSAMVCWRASDDKGVV